MKNIIFLDIDGVLNCQTFFETRFTDYKEAKKTLRKSVKSKEIERLDYYKAQLCPMRVVWLNELCIDTDSKVVVSSTWRKGKTVEELQEILNYCGATFEVIAKTGESESRVRGVEIAEWIEANVEKLLGIKYYDFCNYVIIDDDSDMLLNQARHFFHTDGYSGLTPNTCYKIKRFLSRFK